MPSGRIDGHPLFVCQISRVRGPGDEFGRVLERLPCFGVPKVSGSQNIAPKDYDFVPGSVEAVLPGVKGWKLCFGRHGRDLLWGMG